MQYFLCPRCQFRIPGNKHICSTCGYVIPSASSTRGVTQESKDQPAKTSKTAFWSKFLGLGTPEKPSESQEALS